jgi:hypothetical protein
MQPTAYAMLDEFIGNIRQLEPHVRPEALTRAIKAAGAKLSLSSSEVSEYLYAKGLPEKYDG